MISILIPVYNRDVNELAATLSRQLTALKEPGEIILLDDGSAEQFRRLNSATVTLPNIRYEEAGINQGRIRIRQMLAEKAAYDWLLFIDCDSRIISDQFLDKYYEQVRPYPEYPLLKEYPGLFVGGRIYQKQPPTDCSLALHWKYGTIREAIDLAKKVEDPYLSFMSNNFMIHKLVFKHLRFVSDWQGYGHEDTWIGMQLEAAGMLIKYIDNVVVHEGLERVEVFIPKSEQAMRNLLRLQQLVPDDVLRRHVKLYRTYAKLKSAGLLWLPKLLYKIMRNRIFNNLESCKPSLFYFDLYRLYWFIHISGPHK